MKRSIFLIILFVLIYSPVFSADIFSDVEKFQEFNPDGGKHEFVKDYLSSLSYVDLNAQRSERFLSLDIEALSEIDKGKAMIDGLTNNNVNLRVSKNLIKRYSLSENGLILKVSQIFMNVCEEQIAINKQEKILLEELYAAQLAGKKEVFNQSDFRKRRESVAAKRRESLKGLLESSLLIQKVLISNRTDRFGEFVDLGITENQRKKLLFKIDELYSERDVSAVKSGQSFLEASVAAVREVLVDRSWGSIENIN